VRSRPVSLKSKAIGLLARREYSRSELEQKLTARGAAREEVRPLLDELIAEGYLSDARYARALTAQKQGGYSRRRIAGTLKSKGVERIDIDAALDAVEVDDAAALRALWQRRFGRIPTDERDKARQVRFLQSRGFALSAILKLLREAAAG
jgi:regulatory protein